jgi:hypothetical protein
MKKGKLTRFDQKRNSIKCECGEEISLLPDAKAMGNAIEDHINLHIQKLKGSLCLDAEVERLRDMLIAQVLDRASES